MCIDQECKCICNTPDTPERRSAILANVNTKILLKPSSQMPEEWEKTCPACKHPRSQTQLN